MINKLKKISPTWIAIVICVSTMFIYCMSYMDIQTISYPLNKILSSYDPYVQQFDAFNKGQLHIDWPVDEKLMELDNPYDPEAREGLDYLWDRALYNGKYYSYFGVTPIVTVMYPFYLVSGMLPGALLIQLVYLAIFSVVFPKLVMMLLDRYGEKVPSVYKVLITYVTYLASFNLFYGRGKNPFYYISCTAAIAFLTWFAYLFFKGIYSDNHKKRCIYFLCAGLMYALSVHSRITTAFMGVFFIVPVVIAELILKKRELKKKVVEIGCLGAFVVIGFIVMFVYNAARFDNPMEFGANYQLTVADVSKYEMDITEIDDAFYYYFKADLPENLKDRVTFTTKIVTNVDRYLYVSEYFGLYTVPFMMFSLLAILIVLDKQKSRLYKITVLSTVIGGFVLAWINFCLGGAIFRYHADFSAAVALCSALVVLFLLEKSYSFENKKISRVLRCFLVMVMVVSIYKVFTIMTADSIYLFEIREDALIGRLLGI